jgi:probable HAF family extracellular repeat protein
MGLNRFCLIGLLAVCAIASAADAQVIYSIKDITPIDATSAQAWKLNDLGQAVGQYNSDGQPTQAFLFSNGQSATIPSLAPTATRATSINNLGQIVGFSGSSSSPMPFRSDGSTTVPLGPFPGIAPFAINDSGTVLGLSSLQSYMFDGTTWQYLGTLGGATLIGDINNSGQAVGSSRTPAGITRAVMWENGTLVDLGMDDHDLAVDINDYGDIVFDNDIVTLGTPSSSGQLLSNSMLTGISIVPAAINNFRDIVGRDVTSLPGYNNFYWHASIVTDGAAYDLNQLIPANSGWFLSDAIDINQSGQILGHGSLAGVGSERVYLLTPIPEPAMTTLLLPLLLQCSRRRR